MHLGFREGSFHFDLVDLDYCDHFLFEIFECLLRLSACDIQHRESLPDLLKQPVDPQHELLARQPCNCAIQRWVLHLLFLYLHLRFLLNLGFLL